MKITLICSSRRRGVLQPTVAMLQARVAAGSTLKVRWAATLSAADAIATVKVNLPSTFAPSKAKRTGTLAFAILAPLHGDNATRDAVARCAALTRSSKSAVAFVAWDDLSTLSRALCTRDRDDSPAMCTLHPVAVRAAPALAAAMLAFIEAEACELIDATVELATASTAAEARARMQVLKRVGPSKKTEAVQLLSVFKTIRGVSEAQAEDIEARTAIGRESAARIAAAWHALKEE